MTDSTAQRYFSLGLRAMESGVQTQDAIKAFNHAKGIDPSMCDAWLGLMATSPAHATDPATARGLLKSVRNFGQELRANAVQIVPTEGALGFKVVIDLGVMPINLPVNDAIYARIAASVILAQSGDLASAAAELAKLRNDVGTQPGRRNLVRYVWMCLLGLGERWPEILSSDSDTREPDWLEPDSALHFWQLGLLALKIRAMVGTGDAEGALVAIKGAVGEDYRLIQPSLTVTRAYAMRALGDGAGADKVLADARAWMHDREDLTRALTGARLEVVTAESLATRTDPWDPRSGTSSAQIAQTHLDSRREVVLQEAWAELDKMVGISELKQQLHRIASKIEANAERRELAEEFGEEFDEEQMRLSTIVTGPPGTGKTVTVRILAKLLFGYGVIARPEVYEKKPSDMITGFIGQAGQHTSGLLDEARGGLFFLDEAYGLVDGTGDDKASRYGKEALDVMLARIENEGDKPLNEKIVVVLAGYKDDMDRLLAVNEGLPLRFPTRIHFQSYTPAELLEIAQVIATSHRESLSAEAIAYLDEHNRRLPQVNSADAANRVRSGTDRVANARFVRTVIDKAREYRDFRVTNLDRSALTREERRDQLRTLEVVDVRLAYEEILQSTPWFPHDQWEALAGAAGAEFGGTL